MQPIITLLTDFGTADGYVAELKGVLYSAAPVVTVVDLSHDIAPQDIEAGRLAVAPSASSTFHGRDVFAPAAASLATGAPIDALGKPCPDPVIRRTPEARRAGDGSVVGEVIAIDRFGNAISNLIAPRGGQIE